MNQSDGRGVGYSGRAGGFDARKSAASFASLGAGEASYGWRDSLILIYSYIPGGLQHSCPDLHKLTRVLQHSYLDVHKLTCMLQHSYLDVHKLTRVLQHSYFLTHHPTYAGQKDHNYLVHLLQGYIRNPWAFII